MQRRTKTGCLTCKKRRVKCDEAKPSCAKCTSTGRKCDGYQTQSPPRQPVRIGRSCVLPSGLPSLWTQQEARSFQFFHERTVPSLAGYCGSEFWSGFLLQVSQHEKSIWHSLIALGSLHENFEKNLQTPGLRLSSKGEEDRFAVQHYVAAIGALRRSMDALSLVDTRHSTETTPTNLTIDVCLTSCILFILIEIMASRFVSAIGHIRTGIKILGQVYRDPNSSTYHHPFLSPSTVTSLEMDTLRKFLVRLQNQAFTLTRAHVDTSWWFQTEETRYDTIPTSFSSIAEAHDYLDHYARQLYHTHAQMLSMDSAYLTSDSRAALLQQYEDLLNRWSAALLGFEQSRGPLLTHKEQIGLNIMRMHEYKYTILVNVQGSDDHHWDRYNPVFEKIVSLAASVVDATEDLVSPPSAASTPSFSLDLGIVTTLYDTATLCRDPAIRRRAADVLRRAHRQEGLLNSHVCAVMADKIIELEESAARTGSLSKEDISASFSGFALDQQPRQEGLSQHSIQRSSDVPGTARLELAYPVFDTVNKKAYFIANTKGMDIRIPLPAMSTILHLDQ